MTNYEKKIKLQPEWITIEEAYRLFGEYKKQDEEEKRKLYHREFLALKAYLKKKEISVSGDPVNC